MPIPLWPEQQVPYQMDEDSAVPYMEAYLVDPSSSSSPVGAVIVLPGGGYAKLADHEGEPIARWLNSIGISAFVLKYRVHPYQHPAPLSDVQRAIRHVRTYAATYAIDPDRIGILGFSAGGHLASTAGTHYDEGRLDDADPIERVSCRPDLMILCYPVISFSEYRHQGSMRNLIGEDAPETLKQYLSNELQVNEKTPPTFLWHTSDDPGVPVENSLLFASALSRYKVPFELHTYESGRHGLGLALEHPEAHTWSRLCELWLRRRGF